MNLKGNKIVQEMFVDQNIDFMAKILFRKSWKVLLHQRAQKRNIKLIIKKSLLKKINDTEQRLLLFQNNPIIKIIKKKKLNSVIKIRRCKTSTYLVCLDTKSANYFIF